LGLLHQRCGVELQADRRGGAAASTAYLAWEYSTAVEPPDPDRVESLPDLIAFLEALADHFAHEHRGDDWQNWNVGDYLRSIAAWLEGEKPLMVAEEIREIEADRPTWRGVAMLFEAGRIYE
jgi:hypothetical protein